MAMYYALTQTDLQGNAATWKPPNKKTPKNVKVRFLFFFFFAFPFLQFTLSIWKQSGTAEVSGLILAPIYIQGDGSVFGYKCFFTL